MDKKEQLLILIKNFVDVYEAQSNDTNKKSLSESMSNDFWRIVSDELSYDDSDETPMEQQTGFSNSPYYNNFKEDWRICYMRNGYFKYEIVVPEFLIKQEDKAEVELSKNIDKQISNLDKMTSF